MNKSIKKMIACVITDPYLVNKIDLYSVTDLLSSERIPDSKILSDLVWHAKWATNEENERFGADPTSTGLFKMYEESPRTQKWLNSSYEENPVSEENAKHEFLVAWTDVIENHIDSGSDCNADMDFQKDEEDKDRAYEKSLPKIGIEGEIETLKAQNKVLSNRLDREERIRREKEFKTQRVKKEIQGFLFFLGFIVFCIFAAYMGAPTP